VLGPKGLPPSVEKYVRESVKAAVEDPKFGEMMAARGVDAEYRPGDVLQKDLWREYRLHTEILRRVGLLKK